MTIHQNDDPNRSGRTGPPSCALSDAGMVPPPAGAANASGKEKWNTDER